jgi:glucose-6-phosphate 1-dehydrogenase
MENLESDAFVFFGATGDLAYEQIFPQPLEWIHKVRTFCQKESETMVTKAKTRNR